MNNPSQNPTNNDQSKTTLSSQSEQVGLKTFSVTVFEANYGYVEVQASSEDEACEQARLMYENGDILLSIDGENTELSFSCVGGL